MAQSPLGSIVNLDFPIGRPLPSPVDNMVTPEDSYHFLLLYSESLAIPTPPTVINAKPLLFITDGTVKPSGQLNRLDLISPRYGICVTNWRPVIAQYKDGGVFNDSATATGRRFVMRRFQNPVETFEYRIVAPSADEAIEYNQELSDWLEKAADFWESSWPSQPVYLVSRGPRELYERYSVVVIGSVPDLNDPYASPFYDAGMRDRSVVINDLLLRLEHNLSTDLAPGEKQAVGISSFRSWTISGWELVP